MNIKLKVASIATAIAIIGAAVFAPVTSAQTTDSVIQQLLAQIAALQAQILALQGGPSAPASGCSFSRDLTVGARGDDVTCLQNYLTSTGHFTYSGGATGYFGSITQSAVSAWQAANGVSPAAGYFGAISRAKYNSMLAVAPVPVTPGPVTPGPVTPGPVTPGPVVVPAGTGLTVSSTDQPAATLAVENASRLPMVKAVFTASADGDVTVKSITVERQGLADDSAFLDLVLLDENGNQVGLAKTLNSLHRALLNEPFVVKAGTSRTMTVGANMDTTGNLGGEAGQVAKFAVVSVDAGSSAVNGSFPIVGNGMTINGTLAIGSLASPSRGTLDPGSARTNLEIGTMAFISSGVKWSVGSAEPVILERMRWYQSGSAGSGDLANVKVSVKGVDYETTLSSDGKYYTAVFGSGVEYDKGATMDISIKADIVSGSGRNVDFDIQRRTDMVARGKTFGYYITPANGSSDPTDDTGAFSNTEPYYDAYQHDIQKGSLRVEKSNAVSAGNVALDVSNTELGAFTLESKGEAVQISSYKVTFTLSAGEDGTQIDSLSIVDENGAVVAGPKDVLADETVTFTDSWTVPVGVHAYKLKGKLTTDFEDGDTVVAAVTPGSHITAKGETTGLTITATPSTAVSANTMTVRAASLRLAMGTNPVAQTVVSGINGFLMGTLQYDGTNSGEDVRITSQKLDFAAGAGADLDNLNTCQIWDGSLALNTGGNVVGFSSHAYDADEADKSISFDTHLIVPKGTSKVVDIKCNISSVATTSTYNVGIADATNNTPTAVGKDTGVTVTATITAHSSGGPTMTVAANGTLSVALDVSSPTQERYAIAGKTDVLLSVLKFHADNEAIKLDRIALVLSSSTASSSDLMKVTLWDGATKVGEALFQGTNTRATSTLSSSFIVPKDGDKLLTIKGDMSTLGVNQPATRGHLVAVNHDGEAGATESDGIGQSSGVTINPAAGGNTAGGGVRLVKSYPTLERLAISSNTLANGEMTLYRFKVTADAAGDVGLSRLSFRVSSTTVATTTVFKLYAYSDSSFSTAAYATNPVHTGYSSATNVSAVGTSTWGGVGTHGAPSNSVVFFFNPALTTASAADESVESLNIPAGTSRYFQLLGTFASVTAGDNISVALLGDSAVANNTNLVSRETSDAVSGATGKFVWSPNTTTTSSVDNVDWLNGFQVSGLPGTEMTPQSFTK
ncbi:MAG: peptidoglycan-binding protein [Candidatus Sungbacteria bacterium]|nr:peptidoglycan-binding protein [Candidatus Sungbacteria bacterium]